MSSGARQPATASSAESLETTPSSSPTRIRSPNGPAANDSGRRSIVAGSPRAAPADDQSLAGQRAVAVESRVRAEPRFAGDPGRVARRRGPGVGHPDGAVAGACRRRPRTVPRGDRRGDQRRRRADRHDPGCKGSTPPMSHHDGWTSPGGRDAAGRRGGHRRSGRSSRAYPGLAPGGPRRGRVLRSARHPRTTPRGREAGAIPAQSRYGDRPPGGGSPVADLTVHCSNLREKGRQDRAPHRIGAPLRHARSEGSRDRSRPRPSRPEALADVTVPTPVVPHPARSCCRSSPS